MLLKTLLIKNASLGLFVIQILISIFGLLQITGKGEKNLMAKKQITDQELLASQANAEFVNRNTEETVIESEADSLSLDEIKSNSIIHNSNDFDWDMDNKKLGGYSDAERAKLEVLYTTTLSSINKGEIISGTVVSMNTKDVVLNIGFKSDGMVPLLNFATHQV